jgi:hypothetical protein
MRLKHRCNDERFGDDRMIEATANAFVCIDPCDFLPLPGNRCSPALQKRQRGPGTSKVSGTVNDRLTLLGVTLPA